MSDKLKQLSKIFFSLVFVLQFIACSDPPPDFNTELICPNGSAILVKFVRAKELRDAINAAYINKKQQKTLEGYTPIRLKDGRSFVLKNLPPEMASSCSLSESKVGKVESSYIHHF